MSNSLNELKAYVMTGSASEKFDQTANFSNTKLKLSVFYLYIVINNVCCRAAMVT